MFTGIVEHVGLVRWITPSAAGMRLSVDPAAWPCRPGEGESIAVNGCCLTIADSTAAEGGVLNFDVVPETLAKTTLGGLTSGSRVNLERSATPTTLMGGHVVQGHVDAVGRVESIETRGEWRVRIAAPAEAMAFITPKGSISVEGVSLTVAGVVGGRGAPSSRGELGGTGPVGTGGGSFEVALIPTTLAKTTLGALKIDDAVNLETDILARTVVHYLRNFMGRSE